MCLLTIPSSLTYFALLSLTMFWAFCTSLSLFQLCLVFMSNAISPLLYLQILWFRVLKFIYMEICHDRAVRFLLFLASPNIKNKIPKYWYLSLKKYFPFWMLAPCKPQLTCTLTLTPSHSLTRVFYHWSCPTAPCSTLRQYVHESWWECFESTCKLGGSRRSEAAQLLFSAE